MSDSPRDPAPPTGPSVFLERAHFDALLRARGPKGAEDFAAAAPFPHAVVDGVFPAPLADALAARFPAPDLPAFRRVDHDEQRARLGHLQRKDFAGVDPLIRHALAELNGHVFVSFLERLTGRRGLIGDPAFRGAGVHLTLPGGHLDLHADFNRDRFRGLRRAITAIVYLNPGWDDAWGGALELWPADLSACGARISPRHNRLAVLVHGDDAYHGHPAPLACPPDRVRQSLAAYYYVADSDDAGTTEDAHGAIWVRPA